MVPLFIISAIRLALVLVVILVLIVPGPMNEALMIRPGPIRSQMPLRAEACSVWGDSSLSLLRATGCSVSLGLVGVDPTLEIVEQSVHGCPQFRPCRCIEFCFLLSNRRRLATVSP